MGLDLINPAGTQALPPSSFCADAATEWGEEAEVSSPPDKAQPPKEEQQEPVAEAAAEAVGPAKAAAVRKVGSC